MKIVITLISETSSSKIMREMEGIKTHQKEKPIDTSIKLQAPYYCIKKIGYKPIPN
jgi:hypothetical protein